MLDPRRLLTFREVARQGSFSRAAAALALSQPAVSQQVSALERELGAMLLVRGRSGTVATPAGELLLAHADAVAERLDLADAQMDELAAAERATLRIGSFPSALATIVPAAVAGMRARDPRLEVAIEEGTVDDLEAAVGSGGPPGAVCLAGARARPRRRGGRPGRLADAEPPGRPRPAWHRHPPASGRRPSASALRGGARAGRPPAG